MALYNPGDVVVIELAGYEYTAVVQKEWSGRYRVALTYKGSVPVERSVSGEYPTRDVTFKDIKKRIASAPPAKQQKPQAYTAEDKRKRAKHLWF